METVVWPAAVPTVYGVHCESGGDGQLRRPRDDDKAEQNTRKHGVSFEEATSVFLDVDLLLTVDAADPERFAAVGYSSLARILVVVHCERRNRVRIISARPATRRERQAYDQREAID